MTEDFNKDDVEIAWCPGCGNFGIRKAMIETLNGLNIKKQDIVFVSGIGQAAKSPHYIDVSFFNGLHGRSLPPATGIKAANPELTVIVESGDGDMYGEGGNHFIHAIRRNPDITVIVHDNMVYGLTKGQASPTSQPGMQTPIQVDGVFEAQLNPIALAIAMDASFVARAFSGDIEKTKEIFKMAVQHKGFALVDVFQPCVSFNKINTFKWFKEHTYYIENGYKPNDRAVAFKRALENDKLPLGVFYVNESKKTFEDNLRVHSQYKEPLYEKQISMDKVQELIRQKA